MSLSRLAAASLGAALVSMSLQGCGSNNNCAIVYKGMKVQYKQESDSSLAVFNSAECASMGSFTEEQVHYDRRLEISNGMSKEHEKFVEKNKEDNANIHTFRDDKSFKPLRQKLLEKDAKAHPDKPLMEPEYDGWFIDADNEEHEQPMGLGRNHPMSCARVNDMSKMPDQQRAAWLLQVCNNLNEKVNFPVEAKKKVQQSQPGKPGNPGNPNPEDPQPQNTNDSENTEAEPRVAGSAVGGSNAASSVVAPETANDSPPAYQDNGAASGAVPPVGAAPAGAPAGASAQEKLVSLHVPNPASTPATAIHVPVNSVAPADRDS